MNPLILKAVYFCGGTSAVVATGVATGAIKPVDLSWWTGKEPRIAALLDLQKMGADLQKDQNPAGDQKPAEQGSNALTKSAEPSDYQPSPTVAAKPDALPLPTFDILRLEKDGSLLVAGQAKGGKSVELLDKDGNVIAKTTPGPEGDFVILPDALLAPGGHSLSLQSTDKNGKTVRSAQVGVLNVPEKGQSNAFAMISEAGKASRVLLKPKTLAKKPAAPKTKVAQTAQAAPTATTAPTAKVIQAPTQPSDASSVELKKPDDASAQKQVVAKAGEQPPLKAPILPKAPIADETKQNSAQLPAAATPKPTIKSVAKNKRKPTVRVEAVEVEGDKVFVAGAVKRGALVRVYVNNEPLGAARGTVDNRFLIAQTYSLKTGKHSIRADIVSPKSGKVVSRAQVPLVHEAPISEPTIAKSEVKSPVADDRLTENPAAPKSDPVAASQVQVAAAAQRTTVPAAASPDTLRTGTSIIIKPGDNLWRISQRTYGAGIRYTTIYNANRDQIRDPSRIYIGQIFKIPQIAQSAQSAQSAQNAKSAKSAAKEVSVQQTDVN